MTDVLKDLTRVVTNTVSYIDKAQILETTCSDETKIKVNALKNGFIATKTALEHITEEAKRDPDFETIQKLKETVKRLTSENEAAKKRFAELEKEISGLNKEVIELKEKVHDVRKEMNEMNKPLRIGQIAFMFEKDVATYVYPNGKKIGHDKIFTRMKEWLKDKEKTPQGQEAKERWESLKETVSWSAMHEKVLKELRDSRKGLAHPIVDLEVAKADIPYTTFTDETKNGIYDIICMIELANSWM